MSLSLAETVEAYEKDLVLDALKTTRGNRVKAAKLLHSTERIITYKVKKYGIDGQRFRRSLSKTLMARGLARLCGRCPQGLWPWKSHLHASASVKRRRTSSGRRT